MVLVVVTIIICVVFVIVVVVVSVEVSVLLSFNIFFSIHKRKKRILTHNLAAHNTSCSLIFFAHYNFVIEYNGYLAYYHIPLRYDDRYNLSNLKATSHTAICSSENSCEGTFGLLLQLETQKYTVEKLMTCC